MQLRVQKVSKSFPGVRALDDVSFDVAEGSCHALLGENGAGKSTLGKVLAGLYQPDSGEILLDGRPVRFASPRDALQAGIGIVHQELVFCPDLSIAENLCLHDLPRRGWRLDRGTLRERARSLLSRVRLDLDVDARLGSLSLAQEQLVQIAAAVGLGAKVLVFDEPTSSLGRTETENLFELIRSLQQAGTTILYVSHRLEEIFALCQTATILRDGRLVATRPITELDPRSIVRLMVGRQVDAVDLEPAWPTEGEPEVRLQKLSLAGRFDQVDLELHRGEIVGLAGLVGAGRTEVGETLAGLHPEYTGQILLRGRPVRVQTPGQGLALGIGLIPEDRKRQGLVLGMSVRENTTLSILDRLAGWFGRLNQGRDRELALSARRQMAIRTADIDAPVSSLSGGNQQKVVFARGLATECRILVIDEPTRGVDVGAKREIHQLIMALARAGHAILLISSDLPELLALSHRLVVLRRGRVAGALGRDEATEERVAAAMTGILPSFPGVP